jgi:hypothetical protein
MIAHEAQASDLRVSLLSDGDATFADEINALHNEILDLRETVFTKAVRIGELLVAKKKAVRHGDWLKGLKKNIAFSDQTARNYIRIYENRDDPKFKSVLNLTDAYALFAKKTEREAARANRKPCDDFGGETTPAAATTINEAGGIISETAAKASGRHNGNGDQWDDKPALAHPTHNKIYNPNGGQMPDQAANVLHDHGVIRESSVSEMYAAIERESRSARTIAKEERAQARLAKFAEIEALPEVQVFSQFLNTQSKRDAAMILAVLALRRGIIIDSAATVVTP